MIKCKNSRRKIGYKSSKYMVNYCYVTRRLLPGGHVTRINTGLCARVRRGERAFICARGQFSMSDAPGVTRYVPGLQYVTAQGSEFAFSSPPFCLPFSSPLPFQ